MTYQLTKQDKRSVFIAGVLIMLLLGLSFVYLREALALYGVWDNAVVDAKRAEGSLIVGLVSLMAGVFSAYAIYMAIKPAIKKK